MEVSTIATSASRLVPDMPLRVGSPIARAVYDLMAGERIVHLDCSEQGRVTQVTAVVRRLMLDRLSSGVTMMANTVPDARDLAEAVASRLANYPDDTWWRVGSPGRGEIHVGTDDRCWDRDPIWVVSGGDHTRHSDTVLDLTVVGFSDDPPKAVRYQSPLHQVELDQAADGHPYPLKGLYAHQVLVVGPRRDWHSLTPVLLGVVQGAPVTVLDQPWGPIPLEVMLAGAPQ